jgi:hypothetical protein
MGEIWASSDMVGKSFFRKKSLIFLKLPVASYILIFNFKLFRGLVKRL